MAKVDLPNEDDPKDASQPRSKRTTGRRFKGAIAQHLGSAILSGEFAPGDTLSGELEFSGALEISRSTYREAIQVLAAKGLVESRTKTGTRVLPRDRWNILDPEVLAWAFSGRPDDRLIQQLFELRSIVEPAAAALAASRRTREDLRAMKDGLAVMRRYGLSTEIGREGDRQFHSAILRATHNDALVALSSSIAAAVSWTTQFKQRSRSLPRDPVPDHKQVYDSISAGNALGAQAAMLHLVELALVDTQLSTEAEAYHATSPTRPSPFTAKASD